MLDRVKIWEAARAASDATTFFDPITIDGQIFCDGGTGANNPIDELLVASSAVFSTTGADSRWELKENLGCIASIGTGIPFLKPFESNLKDVAQALVAIATNSEAKWERFQRQNSDLFRADRVFRFNVIQGSKTWHLMRRPSWMT